jgi:hypothetical protein
MTVKISGTDGIDTAQLRAPDGDPVAITIDNVGKVAFPQGPVQSGPLLTAGWNSVGTINGALLLQPVVIVQVGGGTYSAGRFTPNKEGYYQVNASTRFNSTTITYAGLQVRKNNGVVADNYGGIYSTSFAAPSISTIIYMNGTTDYLEIWQDIAVTGAPQIVSLNTSFACIRGMT